MKKIIILLFVFVFSGCKSTPDTPKYSQPLVASNGVVVLGASVNSDTLEPAHYTNFNHIYYANVLNLDTKKKYNLNPINLTNYKSSILNNTLPEGTYKLIGFSSNWRGVLNSFISAKHHNYRFNVKAGEVLNLGYFTIQPIGEGKYISIPQKDSNLSSILVDAYPMLSNYPQKTLDLQVNSSAGKATRSNSVPNMGWGGNMIVGGVTSLISSMNEREVNPKWKSVQSYEQMLNTAKSETHAFNSIRELPSGDIFAGSNLGQVLHRDLNGNWRNIDTGSNFEVTSIAHKNINEFLIGGEGNLLLFTSDLGKSWKSVSSPLKNSLVIKLDYYEGTYIGLFQDGNDLYIYSTDDLLGDNWKQRLYIADGDLGGYIWTVGHSNAVLMGDTYLVLDKKGTLHNISLNNYVVTEVKTGFETTTNLEIIGNTRLLMRGDEARYFFVSDDKGQNWNETKKPCYTLFDYSIGIDNSVLSICANGGFAVGTKITTSNLEFENKKLNSGKRKKAKDAFKGDLIADVYTSNKRNLLLIFNIDGKIYSSTDKGVTWEVENRI